MVKRLVFQASSSGFKPHYRQKERNTMRHIIIITFLTFTGCATINMGGVHVFDRQVDTHANHDDLRNLMQEALTAVDNYRDIKGWDFVFTSAWLAKQLPDGTIEVADGLTVIEDRVTYLKVHPCIGHSAVFHEVGHISLFYKYGDGDMKHTRRDFWSRIESKEERAIEKLCPPDYDPSSIKPPSALNIIGD